MTRHRLYLDFKSREDLLDTFEHLAASGLVPDIHVFVAGPADEKKPHVSYVIAGDGVRTGGPVRLGKSLRGGRP